MQIDQVYKSEVLVKGSSGFLPTIKPGKALYFDNPTGTNMAMMIKSELPTSYDDCWRRQSSSGWMFMFFLNRGNYTKILTNQTSYLPICFGITVNGDTYTATQIAQTAYSGSSPSATRQWDISAYDYIYYTTTNGSAWNRTWFGN